MGPHSVTHPALTPAMQAGTRFTYPGEMEGRVDKSTRPFGLSAGSRTSDLSITSPTLNHCTTKTTTIRLESKTQVAQYAASGTVCERKLLPM